MLRLTHELRDLPRGSLAQRQHAIEGLCALVGAKVGMWLNLTLTGDGHILIGSPIDLGWGTEGERRAFVSYLGAQPRSLDPSLPPLERLIRNQVATASRHGVLPDRAWYGSDHVQEFRRPGGVDDFIYSGRLQPDGVHVDGLSLHRPWGERPFSPREIGLVDAFQRESAWIVERPSPVPAALLAELPPRLREVLLGLTRGLGEKQLAAELKLSPHTVHDHVKALYRRLHVGSRGELLSLCLRLTAGGGS